MNKSDYSLLKSAAVLQEMEQRSGKPIEELQELDRAMSEAAAKRLKELRIRRPRSTAPGIEIIQKGIASCSYRVRRSIPGKGFKDKAAVISYAVRTQLASATVCFGITSA